MKHSTSEKTCGSALGILPSESNSRPTFTAASRHSMYTHYPRWVRQPLYINAFAHLNQGLHIPQQICLLSHPNYLLPRNCRTHISHILLSSCAITVFCNNVLAFASPFLSHRSGVPPSFIRRGSSMHSRTIATRHLQRCASPKTLDRLSRQHRQLQYSFSRLGSRQSAPPRKLCACS